MTRFSKANAGLVLKCDKALGNFDEDTKRAMMRNPLVENVLVVLDHQTSRHSRCQWRRRPCNSL